MLVAALAVTLVLLGGNVVNGAAIFSNDGPFGNMTDAAWVKMQSTGYVRSSSPQQTTDKLSFTADQITTALQASVDWHQHFRGDTRVMTRVKNQGACGSCYIFSVLAVLETLYANRTGTLLSLSEQAVLDCVTGSNLMGCEGGSPYALALQLQQFNIPLEKDYPYSWSTFSTATVGKCGAVLGALTPSKVLTLGFGTAAREDVMATYVHLYGPLQVSIDTRSPAFKTYKSGILDVPGGAVVLTHGVAIVGYGSENGVPYWKIKNSWGPQWGESGYFRMLRGQGLYGIDEDPVGLQL